MGLVGLIVGEGAHYIGGIFQTILASWQVGYIHNRHQFHHHRQIHTSNAAVAVDYINSIASNIGAGWRHVFRCRYDDFIVARDQTTNVVFTVGVGYRWIGLVVGSGGNVAIFTCPDHIHWLIGDAVFSSVLTAVEVFVIPNQVANFSQVHLVIFHLTIGCLTRKAKTTDGADPPAHEGHSFVEGSICWYVETYFGHYTGSADKGTIGGHLLVGVKFAIAVPIDPALQVGDSARRYIADYFYTRL